MYTISGGFEALAGYLENMLKSPSRFHHQMFPGSVSRGNIFRTDKYSFGKGVAAVTATLCTMVGHLVREFLVEVKSLGLSSITF